MDVPPMQKRTAPASLHMSRAPLNWTACVSTTTKLASPKASILGGTRNPSAEPDPLGVGTPLAEKFEVVKSARYGVAYVNILTPKA